MHAVEAITQVFALVRTRGRNEGTHMPEYRVNDRAVDQAMDLIDSGDYDTDTDTDTEWSDAAPSTDEARGDRRPWP